MTVARYRLPKDGDIAADIRAKYGFDGDILQAYANTAGPAMTKWHHYIPLYERYFSRFRGGAVRFLEIGVWKGGSLTLWREYFGPEAIIVGIDIDPSCARHDGRDAKVRIGSQDDPDFLRAVVAEMGGVDVVLDDGSHVMDHIRTSLATLFPLLSDGGTYMIEDLHTAYWPKFGGGLRRGGNFFNDVRRMIDDMHRWYHDAPPGTPAVSEMLAGIHVHDSMVVLDKARVFPPVHSRVGGRG